MLVSPPCSLPLLNGKNGFVISGLNASDALGATVSQAGDINNDGLDDVIIGAPDNSSFDEVGPGTSYVIFGSREPFNAQFDLTNLNGQNGFVLTGSLENNIGSALSNAGDLNGDGIDDLVLGAKNVSEQENSDAVAGYVVYGQANGFDATFDLTDFTDQDGFLLQGLNADLEVKAVSSAGDVNNDGLNDIIIGADAGIFEEEIAGKSYVVFGSPDGFGASINLANLNGDNGFTITAPGADIDTGHAVSGIGDINNDGIDDIITGGITRPRGVNGEESVAHVLFGSEDGFEATIDLSNLDENQGFALPDGGYVNGAGDVNGDGIDDFIVSEEAFNPPSPGVFFPGNHYVIFGSEQGFEQNFDFADLDGSNGFSFPFNRTRSVGQPVSGVGDINADGIDDLILGTLNDFVFRTFDKQKSYVILGSRDGFAANIQPADVYFLDGFELEAPIPNGNFGQATSGAGDFNGDGYDDFIVGAPAVDIGNQENVGQSYLIFGQQDFTAEKGVFDFEQYLQYQSLLEEEAFQGGTAQLNLEIEELPIAALYDEVFYLAQNPDVAIAVANDRYNYGYEHFLEYGIAEGRDPSLYYDESFYLEQNPDVKRSIRPKLEDAYFRSGLEHFLTRGHLEGRSPSSFFDAEDYLLNNPDVAAAVENDIFASAFEHFLEYGAEEGRLTTLLYEEAFYLEQNPDVAAAVAEGKYDAGYIHYVTYGQQEGRDPSSLFDESAYLAAYSDVAAAVSDGKFASGFEHYLRYGYGECRTLL